MTSPLLLAAAHLETPRVMQLGGGTAVFFSAPAPYKNGERPNEDALALIPIHDHAAVLVIADGMGGAAKGEEASRLSIEALAEALREPSNSTGDDKDPNSNRSQVLDGLENADQRIKAMGVGAGSTIVCAEIQFGTVRPYHAGDSHLLVVGQRGRLKLETIPHSPVGYALEAGMLDRERAMFHDDRHLVSNYLGSNDLRIEIGSPARLRPRDTLVLGSDGLFDNLHLAEILEEVRKGPLPQAAQRLAARCAKRMIQQDHDAPSKPDDISFVLYRIDTGWE